VSSRDAGALATLVEVGGGRVEEHAPLGERTTYRVGGSARVFVRLESRGDLAELGPLITATGLALVVVGNGSNLLVQDGEHEIVALHLSGQFAELAWRDEDAAVVATAGAGLDLPVAARRLARAGVAGFEWAVGVPGTVGGAVAMNAGGHGSDLAACLVEAEVWRAGVASTWSSERLALGYRTSAIRSGDVVLAATLALRHGDPEASEAMVREVVRWRREHQPGGANAGSVFRNPPGDHAARLIEAAGCKGLRVGSAQVSEKHANFIQADPGGSADDVYALMTLVRERVLASSGVTLLAENHLVGFGVTP
jgi:UDP-N-acetylmuramate dehydrogenase